MLVQQLADERTEWIEWANENRSAFIENVNGLNSKLAQVAD
jgi:hypothetical protein